MLNFSYKHFNRFALFLLLSFNCVYLQANEAAVNKELVSIKDAWVRPTNPGQQVGAAYMTFLSKQDATLVSIESDVADSIEIHNMTMENGVMKMRMLETLPLKAGKPYKLAPGGFHLMLFDLKKPLVAGNQVNFVLHFRIKNDKSKDIKSKKMKNEIHFKQSIKVTIQTPPENSAH